MPPPDCDFTTMLEVLTAHGVEFIVVGGVGAVLNGASIVTFDLDVVHGRNQENLVRLAAALDELDAHYREKHDRKLRPTIQHLAGPGITC